MTTDNKGCGCKGGSPNQMKQIIRVEKVRAILEKKKKKNKIKKVKK